MNKGTERYQYYMAMSYLCLERARGYMGKDEDLFKFYRSASTGFKNKALKVDLNE